jgi:hypothetical protein
MVGLRCRGGREGSGQGDEGGKSDEAVYRERLTPSWPGIEAPKSYRWTSDRLTTVGGVRVAHVDIDVFANRLLSE